MSLKDTNIGMSSTTLEVLRIDKMNVKYEAMLGLTAELILDDAIKSYQRNKLEHAIDDALASGDEHLFYELSSQLKQLG